jgi:hypothetical protein
VSNRRRAPRFICLAPADVTARVTFDGVIESWHSDQVVVVASHGAARGDEFLMQCRNSSGQLTAWTVGVLACEPPIGEAAPRYRMTLRASPAADGSEVSDVPRL